MANPRTTDRTTSMRLSASDSRTMRHPSQRDTATLPMTTAMRSAQNMNGSTAIPTTETASSNEAGPTRSNTRRPVRNVVNGLASIASAQARTGASNTKPSTNVMKNAAARKIQTHGRLGTTTRPNIRPLVTHGTNARRRLPIEADPITTCSPPGENVSAAVSAPAMLTRSPLMDPPDATSTPPPILTRSPSMAPVPATSTLPRMTTASPRTRPSTLSDPKISTTSDTVSPARTV